MVFTRLGYLLILAIMAVAGVAMFIVAWSSFDADDEDEPFVVPFETVINYARFGTIERLEVEDDTVIVFVREDVDVSQLNTDEHVWQSDVPEQGVEQALREAGISVNGDSGGLPVVQR
jgi:hypothetical protein